MVSFFESVVRDHSKDPPGGRAYVGGTRSLRSVVHHSAGLHSSLNLEVGGEPHFVPRRTDEREFRERVAEGMAGGSGQFDVWRVGVEFPWFSRSVDGPYAVLHRFVSEESVWLLVGDGVLGDGDERFFPNYEVPARFTGGFVSRSQRAVDVLCSCLREDTGDGPGSWVEL